MDEIAITSASLPAKKRIMTTCVKLFLEKGYKDTTMAEIVQEAKVSNSSFQNIFRAKDGVLTELVQFMFGNQFAETRKAVDKDLSPVYVYALETAIQLTLTELNENLREIYVEAYTHEEALTYIRNEMVKELYQTFKDYNPDFTENDFLALGIGSAGIMRGYMEYPCDENFTLEKKIETFLNMSLSAYKVPEEKQQEVRNYINSLDIVDISEKVMHKLFKALAMKFEFSLKNIEK